MKMLFAAAAALSALAATPAFADSASTIIYAQIAPICHVTSPPTTLVNLSGTTTVGNVTAQCNNAAGFTANISSLHSGSLVDQSNGANATTFPYALTVAGLGAVPLAGSGSTFPSSMFGGNAALITPQTFSTSVAVGAPTGPAYAGIYQDTITFALTAN